MARGENNQPLYIKVRVSVLVAITAAIIAVTLVAGCVHVVRGSKVHTWLGVQVCFKEKWTLANTFMNTDDYVHQPTLVAALDDHVVLALVHCGVLRKPPLPPVDELTESGPTASSTRPVQRAVLTASRSPSGSPSPVHP